MAMAAARLEQRRGPPPRRGIGPPSTRPRTRPRPRPRTTPNWTCSSPNAWPWTAAGQAVEMLEEATVREPHNPTIWLARAEGLLLANRIPQALQVLDLAAAPDAAGDVAPIRLARAKLLNAIGRGRAAGGQRTLDADRLPPDQRVQMASALADLMTAQGDAAEGAAGVRRMVALGARGPQAPPGRAQAGPGRRPGRRREAPGRRVAVGRAAGNPRPRPTRPRPRPEAGPRGRRAADGPGRGDPPGRRGPPRLAADGPGPPRPGPAPGPGREGR